MFEDRERMKELLGELGLEKRVEEAEDWLDTVTKHFKDALGNIDVVIVERDEQTQEVAREYFKELGLVVIYAENNDQATKMLVNNEGWLGVIFEYSGDEDGDLRAALAPEILSLPYVFLKEETSNIMHWDGRRRKTTTLNVYLDEYLAKNSHPSKEIKGTKKFEDTWKSIYKLLLAVQKNPNMWKKTYERFFKKEKTSDDNIEKMMRYKQGRMVNYK